MRTRISNSLETIDNEIKNVLGEELYTQCEELRNKPSKSGFQFTRFIKREGDRVKYHFTRNACEKLHEYLFANRDSVLWNAYVGGNGEGYKMEFLLSE